MYRNNVDRKFRPLRRVCTRQSSGSQQGGSRVTTHLGVNN